MRVEILTAEELAALDDDALIDYTAALTDQIDAAPIARDARLMAWDEARDRVPPIAFARLAAASRMSTSGIINGRRSKTEKDHEAGAHRRKVAACHFCFPRTIPEDET